MKRMLVNQTLNCEAFLNRFLFVVPVPVPLDASHILDHLFSIHGDKVGMSLFFLAMARYTH